MIKSVGDHYLIELEGCNCEVINSEALLRQGLIETVLRSGATIIKDVFHTFSPHGVTGVIVIAESHVSIHTWPEHGYAAVDAFTCSPKMNVDLIVAELKALTHAHKVRVQHVHRGPQL